MVAPAIPFHHSYRRAALTTVTPTMDDAGVTGLQTSGSVSSRFVSQNDIDEAKKRKAEEWKAAYARYVFRVMRLRLIVTVLNACYSGWVKNRRRRKRKLHMIPGHYTRYLPLPLNAQVIISS